MSIWPGCSSLALNSLLASALILTFFNLLVLWNVGVQLGFMATLSLIVLMPPLEQTTFGLFKRRLCTDERGTIEFITDGKQLWVETVR